MLAQDSCMSYPIFSLLSFCIATLVLYRVRVLEAYLGSIQDRTEFIEKNSIIIPGDQFTGLVELQRTQISSIHWKARFYVWAMVWLLTLGAFVYLVSQGADAICVGQSIEP